MGHFAHPTTPTLLTNTRKYSDLPRLLASNQDMQQRDQIFMYCTGGVRCERVSMLVHELYPDKEIYQLQGGIQRYLETCSKQQQQQKQEDRNSNAKTETNPSYFVGKNFVSLILSNLQRRFTLVGALRKELIWILLIVTYALFNFSKFNYCTGL